MSPDVMLYARLASGFRPGGPNSTCGPGVPCEFGADETRNYELGIKGQVFDRALSFEASVYRIDWDDIQLGVTAPSGIGYTDNGGKAKSQGAELSIEMRPLTGMLLSAWVAYNDAELTEVPLLSSLVAAAGDRLPYSSRRSGNLSLDQEFPLGARLTGTIGGSVSYIDDRKGIFQRTGAGTARQTFPAYAQVDFRAGARWDTWSLNAFVNNLTDRRGVLRGGLDAVISNPASFTYIQPRTVGLNLAKDF
jgi:outer membrane receptor protein involved in Fe transport